jgi:hypothetical protein
MVGPLGACGALLLIRPLLGGAQLIITESKLLATHQSSAGQKLLPYSCADRVGFQRLPHP